MRDWDLLVVGDAKPDLVLRGDVVPRFGRAEQWLTAADLVLAGSAGVVATGAARLGLRTGIAAHVGCDLFGDLVLSRLTERQVDVSLVVREQAVPTGLSVVLSSPEDRSVLTLPGAISRQRADEVPDEVLARVRHLHVAGFFVVPALAEGTAELFRRARAAGASTSLDTGWGPAGRWSGVADVLPHTDVFLPDTDELRALTGHQDLDRAAAAVRAAGPALAVKAGPDGALGWDAAGAYRAPAAQVDAVDTTGAADSFVAGFLAARLAGHPFATCLTWAACAGSLSMRAAGGTAAQPTASELAAVAAVAW